MRVALLFVIALGSVAHAEGRVVAMIDETSAAALELTLAHAHVAVTLSPAPQGELALDRAASAQRSVLAAGASAGVWIEGNDVCVVVADGSAVRRAPLPAGATPRVFAAIAASLLDELSDPPEHIDVHLDVGPMPDPAHAPELGPSSTAVIAAAPSARWTHTLLEVGLTLSPASYGVEAEVAVPLTPHVRVGLIGGVAELSDGIRDLASGTQLYDAAAEIRYVGSGDTHFDFGLAGGVLSGTLMDGGSDTGGFAALRFSYVRELATTSVSFGVAPMILFDFRGQGTDKTLAAMASIKIGLPI
jgi:hypothetical protein